MIYLILLILGLLIGAVFLAVLLVGDRKEARLEAQKKALREQAAQSGQAEGAWPPPPSAPALTEPPSSPKPRLGRTANRKMVRTFFQIRNAAVGTVVLAYIVYSCFPHVSFGWVLLATALAVGVVWGGIILVNKRRIE